MRKREFSRADAMLMMLAVLLTVGAGMGEWKVVNAALGGLPKVVTLGVPGVALLCFLVRADFEHMRRCMAFLPVYLLYIGLLMVWTLAIWTRELTGLPSIVRGMSKLLYQGFGIVYAIGFVYLCRERAIDCFFAGMVITNALIALLEIPGYGLAASLRSVITCILTFGDAEGYVRALEIHDVTFLFGQFFVYYAALATRANAEKRKASFVKAGVAMLFMLLGLKRTAIPGAMLWAVYAAFILRRRHPLRWVMGTSVAMIAFFWAYLIAIRTGLFSRMMNMLGIDSMGRDYIWGMAYPYYSLSPAFTGQGFEAVDAIVSQWHREGLINHPYPFHNDILKVYVELGFGGFCLWVAVQYLAYPLIFSRMYGERAALVYFSLLGYMSVTYLTDNTAFYYWSCIGLRLIPMAYCLMQRPQCRERNWWPPSPGDFSREVWRQEMEDRSRAQTQNPPRA